MIRVFELLKQPDTAKQNAKVLYISHLI